MRSVAHRGARRIRYRAVLPMALAAFLSACGASGTPGSSMGRLDSPELFSALSRADVPAHRSELAAPVDRVAAAVPGVYEYLGLPVDRVEDALPVLFATPDLRIRGQLYEGERNSDYIDCGETGPGGERADLYEVEFVVLTRLLDDGQGGTVVETLLNGSARRPGVTDDSAVRCRGTGKLERQIATLLRARAGGGGS